MRSLIIYHANCTDGWTAAWIALKALGHQADLHPGFYGDKPPKILGRHIYILDFSYPREVMDTLAMEVQYDGAVTLTVLDHHKTAQAALEGFGVGLDRVEYIFDMNRSGAMLAWDYFSNAGKRPYESFLKPSLMIPRAKWLVEYVQDRDLWRWLLPHSRRVSAAIECVPRTVEGWDSLARRRLDELIQEGEVIERYRALCIQAVVNLARPCIIGGHRIRCANSSEMRFASDAAHELSKEAPFGATFWHRQDGKIQFSLRSTDTGVDVSEVAKMFGGGGHQHAAGFEVDAMTMIKFFQDGMK